jgi:tRNA-splicing ligase RtcB (3'-phosphate/5'-hydroxy nucleic acid ligase)
MSKKLDKLEMLLPMEEIEFSAQEQIYAALEHDFVRKVAIMPDVHCGYDLPIGSIAICDNVISPSWVGVDKNCGMACVITNLKAHKFNKNKLEKIHNKILDSVPVGFNSHENYQDYIKFNGAGCEFNSLLAKPKQRLDNQRINDRVRKQLGSMGGNNHYISIGVNKDGFIAIDLHSGSRNVGFQIANFYIALSRVVDTDLPKGFFHLSGPYGQAYLKDLLFTQNFAFASRRHMMSSILDILRLDMKDYDETLINETHNHAVVLDGGMVLHRKGATPADKGQMGLIPINMKDGTYITIGLGNEKYLSSASHGAGRKMSRKDAKAKLSNEKFTKHMKEVVCKYEKGSLDESPDAYKNGDTVIAYQKGIVVDIVDHIKPLLNIKGKSLKI